jgi:hypothetical protein
MTLLVQMRLQQTQQECEDSGLELQHPQRTRAAMVPDGSLFGEAGAAEVVLWSGPLRSNPLHSLPG